MDLKNPPLRKSLKDKVTVAEDYRGHREDKCIQIRKDKRFDRTKMLRCRIQEEPEKSNISIEKSRIRRNLEALPMKCELLHSDELEKQIEAAVYFRRILGSDKNPPVDVVVDAQIIVPRIIQFLARYDCPKLQLESAWAITNIACGEVKHARVLIIHGAIPLLIDLITNSKDEKVKEQALWAIGNISADIYDSREVLLSNGLLAPLLGQIGFIVSSPRPPSSGISPSLTTMRHVTWTCANLVRGDVLPDLDVCHNILLAFSDLIQSPDEELLQSVCDGCLQLAAHESLMDLLLREGMASRLVELLQLQTVRDAASKVLLLLLQTPRRLPLLALLRVVPPNCLQYAVDPAAADGLLAEAAAAIANIFFESHRSQQENPQSLCVPIQHCGRFVPQLIEVLRLASRSFDCLTAVAASLCVVLPRLTAHFAPAECVPQLAQGVLGMRRCLLPSSEPSLLLRLMETIQQLLPATTLPQGAELDELSEAVTVLTSHPQPAVAAAAAALLDLLP